MDYGIDAPLFPDIARKSTPSLKEIGIRGVSSLIAQTCENYETLSYRDLKEVRKYIRQALPFNILSELFDRFFPSDVWAFPCLDSKHGFYCRLHWECQLVRDKMPMLVDILFSEDIQHVNVCLWKVNLKMQRNVLASFYNVFTKKPIRDFTLLSSFYLRGRGRDREDLTMIEEIACQLQEKAKSLENLHFPVASNIVLGHVSRMKSLRTFSCERSVKLGKRGLISLCAKDSVSRYKLEVCRLGLYRHKYFDKEDGAVFVRNMENLREFSFLDSNRRLSRIPWESNRGDKVLSYSVFKLAIKLHEKENPLIASNGERTEACLLSTNIRGLCVVDRSLKPHYILESAPKLDHLTLDWQEELSMNEEERYEADWFSKMLKKPAWPHLASRLTKLDITFPSAHSPNRYGLPLEDYVLLMSHLKSLIYLRLVGAGMMGPFPLLPTFRSCCLLQELELVKTPIFIPAEMGIVHEELIAKYLKKFRLLDELSSLTQHAYLTRTIANYMPKLEELELQPQIVLGYSGQTLQQVKELSRLQVLERLSIPLSLQDCTSNMPAVLFVLKEFPSLRNLVLSWACSATQENNCNISNRHHVSFLMSWLYMALGAENANINLQLSIKHHRQEYASPVYRLR